MRLFLKEHILLIVVQCVQFSFFFLLLYLSGFRNYSLMLYGFLIGFFLLFCYLLFHYYTRRNFYKKLSSKALGLSELLETTDSAGIGKALDHYTKNQYKLYMNQLMDAEDAQAEHLKFMDRWVHQMKTPLSVIELTAQNLDEPESSNIREETERMKNGLHTVLNMARLRTIQDDFHIKQVSLEKLLHEVNRDNKRLYIRNHVYPHLQVKDADLSVETDEKWVFFMVNQIIQNAVKYSTGKSKRIEISLDKKDQGAVIEIMDFGIGIPKHDLKRIYQAFFTGDNGRVFRESTGMGLFLVKEVADYLGHTLEVESSAGTGTTFRICFSPSQTV
ncbi:sensor histidine kinase [Virgibacillus flavescens]|uniref:sensor histidine kinase n=1 Tax=Virgibacillus flavescens TaxID=1611422 RepID=UPI003D33F26C